MLLDNVAEALRRQCELPAESVRADQVTLEHNIAEAVSAATRRATDHLMQCPICRTQ
jgi:hypothetical protein